MRVEPTEQINIHLTVRVESFDLFLSKRHRERCRVSCRMSLVIVDDSFGHLPQLIVKHSLEVLVLVGGASGQDEVAPLIKEPLLTLDMKKRDYLLEPVYEANEFVPVVQDDKWPPCPVGWKFVDWEFKNEWTAPITINRLDWTPWFELVNLKGYVPAVNEPQGTEQVKLSFDRLQLMPGETARISVCTNPASPASAEPHIMFNWLHKDLYYAVIFNGHANFSLFRKWEGERWHKADSEYAVDNTNRLVTFRG